MPSGVREADVHEILERHQARYEVRPYYVVPDPGSGRKIQAGFDVFLYGTVDTMRLPLFGGEEASRVVDYFQTAAQQIQSKWVKYETAIEVMPHGDSLVLDTHHHFQPEAVLQIRISHDRGLDQPSGPSEEQALNEIHAILHELGVRQA